MSLLTRKRIRIRLDVSSMDPILDSKTSKAPRTWKGNDLQFELGVFYGEALQSITDIASITVQVKATRTSEAKLMEATASGLDLDNTVNQAAWDAETGQHALIAFTGAETNQNLGSADSKEFWLVISAQTNNTPARDITLGAGPFTIEEDGYLTPGVPPDPVEDYYNKVESDARYMMASMAGQNTRWHGGTFYVQNKTHPLLWHEFAPDGEGEEVHTIWGPGVEL